MNNCRVRAGQSLRSLIFLAMMGTLVPSLVGCHADKDDPAGQADELSDPVRRQNAVTNLHRLYTRALSQQNGDRAHAEVKGIADVSVEKLTSAYIDHPEDTQNGKRVIDLLFEMQDPRGLPALKEAMNWRSEVSEEHAIRAAQALANMDVPKDKRPEMVTAVANALKRVTGKRGIDNRMRVAFIRALGDMNDPSAKDVLTEVMLAQSEEQNFLINKLAGEQLAAMGLEGSVNDFIKALFIFAPNRPEMRMNDVAAEGLIRIGRPAFKPLIDLLHGKNDDANAIVKAYIAAVRARNAQVAAQMSVPMMVGSEATFALGMLGLPAAMDDLLKEAASDEPPRRINAALALVGLQVPAAGRAKVREAVLGIYAKSDVLPKAQLLAAIAHRYDPETQSFFLSEAKNTDLLPQIRLAAHRFHALLANKSEAQAHKAAISGEPESTGYKRNFEANLPLLEAAVACDEQVACWISKLDGDKDTATKAAYMLGRVGEGKAEVVTALVSKLDHPEIEVRLAALQSLDHVATKGSPEAVAKIEEMRKTEEGRSIWNNFKRQAVPVQARLRARAN